MPRPMKDLKNMKFGRLTAIKPTNKRHNKYVIWECKCDCGNIVEVKSSYLLDKRKGKGRKSCGCIMSDVKKVHGHTSIDGYRSKTYRSWDSMKQRCLNPNNYAYKYYGGRGIMVCERWLESFENFLEDMGERPDGTTINRINNDGNYESSNCEWATYNEQNKNRRSWRKC